MELDACEGAVLDDRGEPFACCRNCRRFSGVRMCKPVSGAVGLDRCPADPGDASLTQPDGAAGNETEPGDPTVLLRLVEGELEPEADAEDRSSVRVSFAQHVCCVAEAVHRGARR